MNKLYFVLFAIAFVGVIVYGSGCGSAELASAKLSLHEQKYDEAIKYAEKELQRNPKSGDAWIIIAKVKASQNDFAGMHDALKKAVEISNDYADSARIIPQRYWYVHVAAADPLMDAKTATPESYKKAVEEYKMAAAAWPDTSLTYRNLAIACSGAGDKEGALENFKKAWDLGKDTVAYDWFGRYLLQRAMEKKDKFQSDSLTKLYGRVKAIAKGDTKPEVIEDLGNPTSKKKVAKNSRQEEWIYSKLATTITFDGDRVLSKKVNMKLDSTLNKDAENDFSGSIAVFEMIKNINPGNNENLNRLLQAYVGSNRIDEATAAFKLAVQNDPGNKNNHWILGILYRSLQKYDDAILEFKEAIKIDPEYTDAIYDVGATYFNWGVKIKKEIQDKGSESTEYKKKFEDALPWMEKVSQLDENYQNIWYTLGTIYTILGQKDKAEKAFDKMDELKKSGK